MRTVYFGKARILYYSYCNYRRSLVLMYMVYNEVLLHKINEFESILSCLIRAVQPTDYKRKPAAQYLPSAELITPGQDCVSYTVNFKFIRKHSY